MTELDPGTRSPGWGVYLHVPWCRVRCPYCAFNVHPDRDADWPALTRGLLRDAAMWLPCFEAAPESLYFGGGTPSLVPLAELASILSALPPPDEITLEANPGTVDRTRLRSWKELGVTRLSLGIQTFQPRLAHLLNRGHSVGDSERLLDDVLAVGFQTWSFDLMFGLPGQDLDDLDHDLEQVLRIRPPHVSLYGLTVEPGTPWARAVSRGRLHPVDEDTWREMYDRIVTVLETAGWERYEVSNFALAGHRSRHNEAVWRGGTYAGLGPGAHGFLPTGDRTVMTADPRLWLDQPLASRERPTPRQAAADRVLTQIRHADGLDLSALARDTGFGPSPSATERLVTAGLVRQEPTRLLLTPSGFAVADGVTRHLLDGLEPRSDRPTEAP